MIDVAALFVALRLVADAGFAVALPRWPGPPAALLASGLDEPTEFACAVLAIPAWLPNGDVAEPVVLVAAHSGCLRTLYANRVWQHIRNAEAAAA